MRTFVRLCVICGAALLLATPIAEARLAAVGSAGAAPRVGFYYCASKGYPLIYQGHVQLRPGGRYTKGFTDASGRRFKSVSGTGRYTVSGNRMTFVGFLRGHYGIVKRSTRYPTGYFEVFARGERFASFWCYPD